MEAEQISLKIEIRNFGFFVNAPFSWRVARLWRASNVPLADKTSHRGWQKGYFPVCRQLQAKENRRRSLWCRTCGADGVGARMQGGGQIGVCADLPLARLN